MNVCIPSPHEEREKQRRNEHAKKQREKKKKVSQRVMDFNFNSNSDVSPEKNQLLFFAGFLEKLKIVELKELCRINCLMVSGTKKELVFRLTRAKFHGSPGKCPICKQSKLEFTYPDADLISLPCEIRCKHLHGQGLFCRFYEPTELLKSYQTDKSTARFSNPLVDNANKTLSQIDNAVTMMLGGPAKNEEEKVDEMGSDDDATTASQRSDLLVGGKRKRDAEGDDVEAGEEDEEGGDDDDVVDKDDGGDDGENDEGVK